MSEKTIQSDFDMACDTFYETVEELNLDPEDAIVFNKDDSDNIINPALQAFQEHWDEFANQEVKCPHCGAEYDENELSKDAHSYEKTCKACGTHFAVHKVKRIIYKIIPPKELKVSENSN